MAFEIVAIESSQSCGSIFGGIELDEAYVLVDEVSICLTCNSYIGESYQNP
jgi:hypothetical protein